MTSHTSSGARELIEPRRGDKRYQRRAAASPNPTTSAVR